MKGRTRLAIGCVLLAVPAGLWFYNGTACACLTPDKAAHVLIRSDIRRVLETQQLLWTAEHRYSRSLDSLGFPRVPTHRLMLTAVTESSFRIEGASVRWPGVTCQLDVTPQTASVTALRCVGHVPGRLGW